VENTERDIQVEELTDEELSQASGGSGEIEWLHDTLRNYNL
jgi:hypothetical protein